MKGIHKVSQLLEGDCNSNFLTFENFQNKYNLPNSYLQYYGIISSLMNLRKTIKLGLDQDSEKIEKENSTKNVLPLSKPSRLFYRKLVTKKAVLPKRTQNKWEKDCNILNIELKWNIIYVKTFHCTKSTKLRIFLLKLLHRRIPTNEFLCKVGIKNDDTCALCRKEKETLIHLFWDCKNSQTFWKALETLLFSHKILDRLKNINKQSAIGLNTELELPLLSLYTTCKIPHLRMQIKRKKTRT